MRFHFKRYHEGECKKQFITLRELGEKRTTSDDIEWQLAQLGALATELEGDPAEVRPSMKLVRGGAGTSSSMATRGGAADDTFGGGGDMDW